MLFRVRWFIIAFATVLALAPLSGIVAAALLARLLGCEINDAGSEPCTLAGNNYGPWLTDLTLTAGLGWITYSILFVVVAIWAIVEALALLVRWWRRARTAT